MNALWKRHHLKRISYITVFFFMILVVSSCDDEGTGENLSSAAALALSGGRSFYMGFTPWPYDATMDAVNDTYAKINANGDIVDQFLMTGIPWQEALDGDPYHANVEGDIADRQAKTDPGRVIYLAIDLLNSSRDGLAPHWGENINEALTSPWDTYSFDDQDVIDAFTSYALDMIGRFNPKYFSYVTEISELILNDPARYSDFKAFAAEVYPAIKAAHPDLPVLVTVAFKHPGSPEAEAIKTGMADIYPYYDMLGISTYPYIFFNHDDRGDPANLPDRWLSQVRDIAGTKPVAVTETGWIAEDIDLPAYSYSATGTPAYQDQYLQALFREANGLNAEFIIWFTVVDYDALWSGYLGDDISRIWRDTGLYDGGAAPRQGLQTWQGWLGRTRR